MDGNINKSFLVIALLFILSCSGSLKKSNMDGRVYIGVKGGISYNADEVEYYIINKTNNDIKVLCNPDFFKRKKDSLFLNTIPNPSIKIYNNKTIVEPVVLNVFYTEKKLDSLSRIKETYTEVDSLNLVDIHRLNILKSYIKIINKNDSVKFLTKINFENEPRFYDYSEIEGYILDKNKNYMVKICLNEDINKNIKFFLEKENVYLEKICSKPIRLEFIKTNYSK
ncbi:hypothetical protein PG291_08815 [Riemerella anatipestifer]|nr:hypothetical protein [Riemerella anatipestifer]